MLLSKKQGKEHFVVLMIVAMVNAAAGDLERARYWSTQARKKRSGANQDHFFAAFRQR
jgi:hypothetical protein